MSALEGGILSLDRFIFFFASHPNILIRIAVGVVSTMMLLRAQWQELIVAEQGKSVAPSNWTEIHMQQIESSIAF